MAASPRVTHTGAAAPDTTPVAVTWELVHAEPGALVYLIPGVKPAADLMGRRTAERPVGWTPGGAPEHAKASHHDEIEHPVLHYAGYIGRVGVLAAALGMGAAVAGAPAWAEPAADSTTSSSETNPEATVRAGNRTTARAPGSAARRNTAPSAPARGSDGVDAPAVGSRSGRTAAPGLPESAVQSVPRSDTGSRDTGAYAPDTRWSVPASPAVEAESSPIEVSIPTTTLTMDGPAATAPGEMSTPATSIPAPATSDVGLLHQMVTAGLARDPSRTTIPAAQAPVLYGVFAWLRDALDNQDTTRDQETPGHTESGAAPIPGPASHRTVARELHTTDLESNALTYSLSGGPAQGTVTLNPITGAFSYAPLQAGRRAVDLLHDMFTVTVDDSHGTTAIVPVSVDVDRTGVVPVTTLTVSDLDTEGRVHVSVIVTESVLDPVTYLVVHDPAYVSLTATAETQARRSVAASAAVKPARTTTAATTAATAVTGNVNLEGEALLLSPAKSGSRYSDSTASGGKALLMSTKGSASTTVSLPASTGLVIRARGDQYKGAPTMQVSLDGTVIATIAVSSTSWTDYTIPVAVSAGTHTVSVAYTNDLRASASKDRNLRIDKITVVAATVVTPPSTQAPAYFGTADWLWKPIAANPTVAANSSTWVSYLSAPGAKRIANLYNYGVTLVPASAITTSTPRYDVGFTKAWGADPFGSYTVALPRGTRIPPGSDGHIVVLDPVTGQAFGIWQARYTSATDTWSGSWGGRTPINGNGIDQTGSATAAGISRAAGVVTAAEFNAAIAANTGLNHALVFSTDIAGPGFVGPAIKSDGTNIAGVATPMPQGYRIQLDPSINVDAIPNITPGEKVIAKTLQTHGAYVVDQGGARMAFAFETVPDATSTNPGAVYTKAGFAWDYYDMNHIPWSQLRVLAA